jgi:aldehyde dehydrogenase (NAD+)
MGKIRAEGIGEVQEMIDICDFAVGLSRQLYGLTMHSERPSHRMYEQWLPLGPIGIITAFNFPAAVWSWNAAIAAVAGDTMVWKPSELAPLTAVAIQHIANRVMADYGLSGLFNLAVGGPGVGQTDERRRPFPPHRLHRLHPRRPQVAQTVAGRLGRSLLELGGNNAIIVEQTADLDLAVRAILFGAVGTAGQRCTSTRRLIAHESSPANSSSGWSAYKQVPIGDPLDPGTLMGPLIDEDAVGT